MKKHMQKTGYVVILIACSMIIGSFIAFAALNSGGTRCRIFLLAALFRG